MKIEDVKTWFANLNNDKIYMDVFVTSAKYKRKSYVIIRARPLEQQTWWFFAHELSIDGNSIELYLQKYGQQPVSIGIVKNEKELKALVAKALKD